MPLPLTKDNRLRLKDLLESDPDVEMPETWLTREDMAATCQLKRTCG